MEFTGKTYEEALQKAKDYFSLQSDDALNIDVLAEGSKGFLGIGAKDYLIRAERKEEKINSESVEKQTKVQEIEENERDYSPREDSGETEIVVKKMEKVKAFLSSVYDSIGYSPEVKVNYDGENINVQITGDGASHLIGRRGQGLDSLQFLTGIVANKDGNYKRILIDIENYRDKRQASLEQYAKSMARRAIRERRNVRLDPMNPYERRIVHFALQKEKKIETYSQGEDPNRYIVISYKGYKNYDKNSEDTGESTSRPKYDYGSYQDDSKIDEDL